MIAELATTLEPCPHCAIWLGAEGDRYCGFCGRLRVDLRLEPERIVLITGLAPLRVLRLHNHDPRPRRVELQAPDALTGLWVTPAGPQELETGAIGEFAFQIDEALVPAGFVEASRLWSLVIDDDPELRLDLPVTLRAGPRPELLTPFLDFGELAEGREAERLLGLRNAGAVPLRLDAIETVGSNELEVGALGPLPLAIAGGGSVSIPVIWNTRREEVEADGDDGRIGLFLRFGNYAESLFVPARARRFRLKVEARPPRIDHPRAHGKHELQNRVELLNRGSVDVEIVGFSCDQPWLSVAASRDRFTLRYTRSAGEAPVAPRIDAGERFAFEVVSRPRGLSPGRHTARASVLLAEPAEALVIEVELEVLPLEPYEERIGLDFGTTHSVIAVPDEHGDDYELVRDEGEALIPSVLAFVGGPDSYRIGVAARREAEAAPERAVRSIKRILGYQGSRELMGRAFTPEELVARILEKLVERAESWLLERSGRAYDIRHAIVTIPVSFYDSQILAILRACSAAGLEIEAQGPDSHSLLDEPTAATLHYFASLSEFDVSGEFAARLDQQGGLNAVVFDYGGGTLDISVTHVERLAAGSLGLSVLATLGDETIGGDSLDLALLKRVCERTGGERPGFEMNLIVQPFAELERRRRAETWPAGTWARVLATRQRFMAMAERLKIELSSRPQSSIVIAPELLIAIEGGQVKTEGKALTLEVKKTELDQLAESFLQRAEDVVVEALLLSDLNPEQIHYLIHTGRQSQMPAVRERIRALFPTLPPSHDLLDPAQVKVCVAKGAAHYGRIHQQARGGGNGIEILREGRRLPHSYGIERQTGFGQREFVALIPRGASYPIEGTLHLAPHELPRASTLDVVFLRNGGSRRGVKGNREIRRLGRLKVDLAELREAGCEVRLAIDANRRLTLAVGDQVLLVEEIPTEGPGSWWG
ncbi:MAG: Hsp70 family protein [Thermoanaerobaculia bacterium]|nr:Hsp70 family protein [Thermoanaerobaculia bacterium]